MRKGIAGALALVVILAVLGLAFAPAGGNRGPIAVVADADADAGWAAPAMVGAADGAEVGAVTVSWDAVPGAPFYRIGWVSADDAAAAQAQGRHWLDAFAFSDVANRGQTSFNVQRLAPGRRHAFIVASLGGRFGQAAWSEWVFLTPAAAGSLVTSTPTLTPAVPTPTPNPTPAVPTPTPNPTPAVPTLTPNPAPAPAPTPDLGGGPGDYRIKVVTGSGFGDKTGAGVYVLAGPDTAADLASLAAAGGASEAEACRVIIRDGRRIGSVVLGADDRVRVDFLVESPPFRPAAVNYLCVD